MYDFDDLEDSPPEPRRKKLSLDGEWECRVDYFKTGGLAEIVMHIRGDAGEYYVAGGTQTHRLLDIVVREERGGVKVSFKWANKRGQRGSGSWTLRASGNVLDGTWTQDGVSGGPWQWTGLRKDAVGIAPALPEPEPGPPIPSIDGEWDCLCDYFKLGELVSFILHIDCPKGQCCYDGSVCRLMDIDLRWDGTNMSVTFRWSCCGCAAKHTAGSGSWLLSAGGESLTGSWTQDGLTSGPWMWNCKKRKLPPPPEPRPEPPPVVTVAPEELEPGLAGEALEAAEEQQAPPPQLLLSPGQAAALQGELIAALTAEDLRRRLGEALASGASRKLAETHQTFCLQAQRRLALKYGFESSRRAVAQLCEELQVLAALDPAVASNDALLQWLSEPEHCCAADSALDGSPSMRAGGVRAPGYRIHLTDADDEAAARGVERCRGALACAHQDLYRPIYPGIQQQEWLIALGRDNMCDYLRMEGVIVLHAECAETGEVVGYVSCQVQGLDSGRSTPSSTDRPRPSTVAVDFDLLAEAASKANSAGNDEAEGPADAEADAAFGEFSGPNATVGHIGVLEQHRGRGVGSHLMEALLEHLEEVAPKAAVDLRINVVELNTRAVEWYRHLGFVPVDVWLRRFSVKSSLVPVAFITMQRRARGACIPWKRFFGSEARGEKVLVLPEASPSAFLEHADRQPWPWLLPATVGAYDQGEGMHELADGRVVDLTLAFSQGRVRFERPLHAFVASG